tara:strand:+ start:981 stop:1484 length:504 start_codon:yes stop_codon:yes gene_type:complete
MKRIPFTKKETNTYIEERKVAPCFICEIVEGKPLRDKHRILYEDEQVIVFFSIYPTHYGHTLVCPKKHSERVVNDLAENEYLYLQKIVHKIGKAVEKVTHPERLYIASFGSQQMNAHVHFHIVPLPKGVPILQQQMAAMMSELVGIVDLEKSEWESLAKKIMDEIEI